MLKKFSLLPTIGRQYDGYSSVHSCTLLLIRKGLLSVKLYVLMYYILNNVDLHIQIAKKYE